MKLFRLKTAIHKPAFIYSWSRETALEVFCNKINKESFHCIYVECKEFIIIQSIGYLFIITEEQKN